MNNQKILIGLDSCTKLLFLIVPFLLIRFSLLIDCLVKYDYCMFISGFHNKI